MNFEFQQAVFKQDISINKKKSLLLRFRKMSLEIVHGFVPTKF